MLVLKKQKIKEKNKKKHKKCLIVIFTLAAVLISGFIYEKIGEYNNSRKYQPPGQLIEINGHKMHIYGEGISKNTPTVVLLPGGERQVHMLTIILYKKKYRNIQEL